MKAAREMTSDFAVSDATLEALKANFDSECLTDLVITIAFYIAVVRCLGSMRIDVEP